MLQSIVYRKVICFVSYATLSRMSQFPPPTDLHELPVCVGNQSINQKAANNSVLATLEIFKLLTP